MDRPNKAKQQVMNSGQQLALAYIKETNFVVPFNLPFFSVESLHLCYQGTILVNCSIKLNQQKKIRKLYHISLQGDLINQFDLGVLEFSRVKMMKQQYVIVQTLDISKQNFCLVQWNLFTNQKKKLKCGNGWHCRTFLFTQSNLICVVEKYNPVSKLLNSHSETLYNISYYEFPLKSDKQEPVFRLLPEQNKRLGYWDITYKLNDHSGLAWIKEQPPYRSDLQNVQYSTVHILDLRQENKSIKTYKISYGSLLLQPLFSYFIADICQLEHGILYVKCIYFLSSTKLNKYKIELTQQQLVELILNEKAFHLIWDYEEGKTRQAHFNKMLCQQEMYQIVQFSNGLRPFTRIKKQQKSAKQFNSQFKLPKISNRQLSTYYISYRSQQVICIQRPSQMLKNKRQDQISYQDYNRFSYMEYTNKQNKQGKSQACFDVRISRIEELQYRKKVITAYFINQIIRQCDDDLVLFVVEMIGDGNKQEKYGLPFEWRIPDCVQFVQSI